MRDWRFWVLVVLIGLALVWLGANLFEAQAASAGCPEPGPRVYEVYMANVQQAHVDGMWACFVHPYRCLGK